MFLCGKCHNPKKHKRFVISYGRCQHCPNIGPRINCLFLMCEPVKEVELDKNAKETKNEN